MSRNGHQKFIHRPPDVNFGRRLLACRLAAGLTPGQVAARVGGSENTIRGYESGRSRPGKARYAALVELLGPALLAKSDR
jgi:transcriptional regulator with XRE-family HTH domain